MPNAARETSEEQAIFWVRLVHPALTVSKASVNAEPGEFKKLCRLLSKIERTMIDAHSNLKGPVKNVYKKMLKYDIAIVVTRPVEI